MKAADNWKERAWNSLCEDCKLGGPISDNEIGATASGCFRCGKGSDDPDKQEMLATFRSNMQKIRDGKPGPAEIEKLKSAVKRLVNVAQSDTGQSRRVANFLLAWWNASEFGGFDFTDLWNVDLELAEDMVTVFTILPNFRYYPDVLGFGQQFEKLAVDWRPKARSETAPQGTK